MPQNDPQLTVRFEDLGRDTTRIKSYRISSSYLVSTDGFEFVVYDTDRRNLRDLVMQPVELLLTSPNVSGAQVALGRIDVTTRGNDGMAVTCQGRDYVADMVESHLDPSFKVQKDEPLVSAISRAGAPVGIDTVFADGDVGLRSIRTGKSPGNPAPQDFSAVKLDELKPQPGLGIYEWCNRAAARNGCTMQPGQTRTELSLSKPDYTQEPCGTIRRSLDQTQSLANNVVRAVAREDYGKFPTFTLFTGKGGGSNDKPSALKVEANTRDVIRELNNPILNRAYERIVDGRRKPDDPPTDDRLLYRLLYQQDQDAQKQEQLLRVATRAFSERFKDTLVYTVTLKGHEDPNTGRLWAVNSVVQVHDEVCDLEEKLWVASRDFTYQEGTGDQTEMECWRLGSFQL